MNVSNYEIMKLVAETLKCDINSISECTGLGHHPKWDSLGHMMIMSALESKFKVVIDENNIGSLLTICGIVAYLDAATGSSNG